MDKNTIIGLVLIFAVFIGYGILTAPSKEERMAMQTKQDSIIKVQEKIALEEKTLLIQDSLNALQKDSLNSIDMDSLRLSEFGGFVASSQGTEDIIKISNDFLDISFSSLGGKINQVKLKDYKTYYKKDVEFFENNTYGLNLSVGSNIVKTKDLYFEPYINGKPITQSMSVSGTDSIVLLFKAKAIDGDKSGELVFKYIIRGNDYRVGYDIIFNNLNGIITDQNTIEMDWLSDLKVQEKDKEVEVKNSSIYYYLKDEVEYLKENGTDDKKEENAIPIKWIAYKQQFFSTALIANGEEFKSAQMETKKDENKRKDSSYLRTMTSLLNIPFDNQQKESLYSMSFFFGPNKYGVISDYNLQLEEIIPLGWGFFPLQWINRFVIIPVFDFLSGFGWNMGIVILILTILVKIVLFPLAYKSYSSSAKMKVIQPEVQKINEKYPKQDQAMEKQKAVMGLYKKAGINPMAGCLPMILQFPILVAMFRFFPASIELRQKSFLWADDLSSYDSIFNLPFSIPFYGSNISLFCLLMTVAQIFYTKMTMQQQQGSAQMPGMKFMMYLMPVFMLFMLNKFSAALNYYYFVSMCFTFLQVWLIRKTINEKKVLDTLKANENKPLKKSKWQERIEAMEKRNRTLVAERQKQQQRRK